MLTWMVTSDEAFGNGNMQRKFPGVAPMLNCPPSLMCNKECFSQKDIGMAVNIHINNKFPLFREDSTQRY